MITIYFQSVKQDCKTMMRSRAEWMHSLVFFIIFVCIFGIGLGFDNKVLIAISPAIIWIAFLLSSLFTIESIFRREMDSGILEQFVLSQHPLWWLLIAKTTAIWIVCCLPLIALLPVLGLLMQLHFNEISVLMLSVFIGSPAIILMGVLGAILTITLPRAGVFLNILLLPLYIPILILGESAIVLLLEGQKPLFQMILLGAISVLALTLVPHAAAGALKVAME